MNSIKIVRVVTVPEAFVHFKPFLKLVKQKSVQISLVSSPGSYEKVLQQELQLGITPIEISREIKPVKDLQSLISLIQFFRKNKFDIIHSSTPKAGLLSALAGLFVPNSIRLHTFTGQRWANMKGPMRCLLMLLDKLVIKLNTQCYADSPSQISFLVKEGVARGGELKCLLNGSYGGVDCDRFNNDKYPAARAELLNELRLGPDSVILLYVGQLSHDKGIDELVTAFKMAQKEQENIKLVLIGVHREGVDQLKDETLVEIKSNTSIFSLGYKTQPEKYFSGADIFCLPSHREGFGTVVLEAAACELPTIGTNITGLKDAILDSETGILVECENVNSLSSAITALANSPQKRKMLGANAKNRARRDFDAKLLAEAQWQEYEKLIKELPR
ncbi:glycosyltransferase [bacterium]|nr:glycosyltransferase [bacterium]